MDKEFKTTFIPKAPVAPEAGASMSMPEHKTVRPIGLVTAISVLLVVVVGLLALGVYLYEGLLNKNLVDMKASLELAKKEFEPSLIVEMQALDRRLNVASELLVTHAVVTPLFETLQRDTLPSVRFNLFDYMFVNGAGAVRMSGEARSYPAIALQSNVFGDNQYIRNHLFSNFARLDSGRVSFDLEFTPSSDLVYFDDSARKGVSDTAAAPMTVTIPQESAKTETASEGQVQADPFGTALGGNTSTDI